MLDYCTIQMEDVELATFVQAAFYNDESRFHAVCICVCHGLLKCFFSVNILVKYRLPLPTITGVNPPKMYCRNIRFLSSLTLYINTVETIKCVTFFNLSFLFRENRATITLVLRYFLKDGPSLFWVLIIVKTER